MQQLDFRDLAIRIEGPSAHPSPAFQTPRPHTSPWQRGVPDGEPLLTGEPVRATSTRYVIRWSRVTEMVALAASAGGVLAVVARLV